MGVLPVGKKEGKRSAVWSNSAFRFGRLVFIYSAVWARLGKLPWISKIPLQGNGIAAISKIARIFGALHDPEQGIRSNQQFAKKFEQKANLSIQPNPDSRINRKPDGLIFDQTA